MIIFDTGWAEIGEADDDERARLAVGLVSATGSLPPQMSQNDFCK
jgi:hypothetical protein